MVIRWTSTLIFLLCLALFWIGVRSWELVAFAALIFAIAGWAWGAATAGPWTADIDENHPDALGSLDLRDRGLTQTTAGGITPSQTRVPSAAPPAVPPRTT